MILPLHGAAAMPVLTAQVAVPALSPSDSVSAFEQVLERQQATPADTVQEPEAVTQANAGGLALSGTGPAQPTGGDMILDGLSRLRGVFDNRTARISETMRAGGADAASMMNLQVELVNFTMLVDMTSKLTGKSTQVIDTLIKGQ